MFAVLDLSGSIALYSGLLKVIMKRVAKSALFLLRTNMVKWVSIVFFFVIEDNAL